MKHPCKIDAFAGRAVISGVFRTRIKIVVLVFVFRCIAIFIYALVIHISSNQN